jgi:hypothetical protein
LSVPELEKPGNVWCQHASPPGSGCGIYATRPDGCRRFICNWLKDSTLGNEWNPERSKIVLSSSLGGRGLRVSVDPAANDVWRSEPFYAQIKEWSSATLAGFGYVAVFAGEQCFVVFPEEDLEVSLIELGSALRVGYVENEKGRQPIVQIRSAEGSVQEFRGATYPTRSLASS